MSFWDGTRWVSERPAKANASKPNRPTPRWARLRDLVATIPILFLLPALLSPLAPAAARSPLLSVSGVAVPGGQVSVVGRNLPAQDWVQITWDASPAGMPKVLTTASGRLSATVTIPADALAGTHVLAAIGSAGTGLAKSNGNGNASTVDRTRTRTYAVVSVAVVGEPNETEPPAPVTPSPVPPPTSAPTAAATPDVTTAPPVATPDPDPTATPRPPTPPPPTPPPPPPPTAPPVGPATPGLYGPAINMDGLGNTQVGGPNGSPTRAVATTFRATGALLSSIRQQLPNPQPGYAAGNGGTLEFSVHTDASGVPSGTVLGLPAILKPGVTLSGFNILPQITFPAPIPLTVGRFYHIVVRNIDPNPAANFTSIDSIVFESFSPAVAQPGTSGEWTVMRSESGTGGWTEIYGGRASALIQLNYAGGLVDGVGYVYRRNLLTIGSLAQVFTPKADRTITKASVRLWRSSGTGALTIRLESGGSVIASASTTNVAGKGWVTVPLTANLQAGRAYRLVLSAPSGTTFQTYSLEKGSHYGYHAATYFTDGSVEGDSRGDLQFYLGG